MLHVVAARHSPRLVYTLELLLGELLGLTYVLHLPGRETVPASAPVLGYGVAAPCQLPACGLLTETGVRQAVPVVRQAGFARLFPQAGGTPGLNFDLLAAAFYVATDYEKYQQQRLDAHGRYDAAAYPSAAWGLDRMPLVHVYAQHLRAVLERCYPGQLAFAPPVYAPVYTFDIDFPWLYLHKPAWVQAAGLGRDLLRGQAGARLHAWRSGRDPYDTFEDIFARCVPTQTRFFFLIERSSPYDSRFTWRIPAYQALIRRVRDRGYTVGIHPSYRSSEIPGAIAAETAALARVLDAPVRHARQHFLRYRYPDTCRALLDAGIEHDYTLCRFDRAGFPCGMARPFGWYDLLAERQTPLRLHPTLVMDRSLQGYLRLDPAGAAVRLRELIATTRTYGGTFTMLLHNDTLSDTGDWRGWRQTWLDVLADMATD
ncbi:MAG: hypothetical protein OHK0039_41770 [Bacteroidia bacterium]